MRESIIKRNNVKVSGEGEKTILFAHGFGCDQNMWRFVAPEFEDDFQVVLFDYVGSGKSEIEAFDAKRYGNLDGYAKDVIEICTALNLKDVVFVGHSVSSMIGALATLKRPDLFSNLIQLVPSPCYINDPPDYVGGFEREDLDGLFEMMDKNFIGWASFLAPVVMKNPERPELEAELETSFCSTDPKIARSFAEATFYSDNRADLEKIKTPSLIVQVTDDAVAPVSVGEYMNEKIPNSKLVLMNASGHCPHMSHPRETIEIMRNHLKSFNAKAIYKDIL